MSYVVEEMKASLIVKCEGGDGEGRGRENHANERLHSRRTSWYVET